MKTPIVFMFSGQGSQYYHMGKELYEKHARFKLWMDHCDKITYPLLEISLIDVIYNQGNKFDSFDQVIYTNPALLSIEYCLAKLLIEMDVKPDYLVGYSLGEIIAAIIAGAISLEEGLLFSIEYARLLETDAQPAEMLAIIASTEIIEQYPEAFQNISLAGKNFHNSFVVSGLPKDMRKLKEELDRKNIISQKLAVNYGFHTELMTPLKEKFLKISERINFSPIRIPIISALKIGRLDEVSPDHFWEVTRHSVNFEKTIQSMLENGDYIFIDVGPSGTLATFVKYLLPEGSNSLYFEVINQFGKDLISLEKIRSNLKIKLC